MEKSKLLSDATLSKMKLSLVKGGAGGYYPPMSQDSTCAQESTCTLVVSCVEKPKEPIPIKPPQIIGGWEMIPSDPVKKP